MLTQLLGVPGKLPSQPSLEGWFELACREGEAGCSGRGTWFVQQLGGQREPSTPSELQLVGFD